jgi:hypothetical protein
MFEPALGCFPAVSMPGIGETSAQQDIEGYSENALDGRAISYLLNTASLVTAVLDAVRPHCGLAWLFNLTRPTRKSDRGMSGEKA